MLKKLTLFFCYYLEQDAIMTMNLRLAYSDAELGLLQHDKHASLWTEHAHIKEEDRPLMCSFNYSRTREFHDYEYSCDPLFMFQLGSVPHKRYLLNMKLPLNIADGNEANQDIGQISEIDLIVSNMSEVFG